MTIRSRSRIRAWLLLACAVSTGPAFAAACSSDGDASQAPGPGATDGSVALTDGGGGDASASDDGAIATLDGGPSDGAPGADATVDAGPPDAPFITDSGFVYTPAVVGTRCRYALVDGSAGQITCNAPAECCESLAAPATCIGADADTTTCALVATCDGPEDCKAGEACAVVSYGPPRVACVPNGGDASVLCHTRADCPNGQTCCVPRPILGDGGYGTPTSTVAYVSGGCVETPLPMHACQ